MNPAIRVEGLSKRYRIGSRGRGEYRTLREALVGAAIAPYRRITSLSGKRWGDRGEPCKGAHSRDFWALKDVSFEVQSGEVVGIIGRNGAGKSTLLKILSRVTEPTNGRAEIRGRVGSLLEVGTGFHPELTGRENIYLNGSILGMSRWEVAKKFDEIVNFAELDQFLDTPVKRYSSGMYVRLAFAVAAHLEPEILIIDEVLAVGDIAFQRKCLGRMSEVGRSGRTIIFVSHNMAAIQSLCDKSVWIDSGEIAFYGDSRKAVSLYTGSADVVGQGEVDLSDHLSRPVQYADSRIFRGLRLINPAGSVTTQVHCGEPLKIELAVDEVSNPRECHFDIFVENSEGLRITRLSTLFTASTAITMDRKQRIDCLIESVTLTPDRYYITLNLWAHGKDYDRLERVAFFDVLPSNYLGYGRCPDRRSGGLILFRSDWRVCPELDLVRESPSD